MSPQLLRRRPTPPQLAILAAALVVVALVGGTALRPVPTAPPGPAAASATPESEPSSAAWGDLELDVLARTATLEPTRTDRAGLLPDTELLLRSLTDEPAVALAARLAVDPAVELVAAGGSGDTIRLRPATQLAAGTAYRFTLQTLDGAIAGSWAWRVRGPVAVLSTLPGDAASGVPTNTGIEVTFNQAGVADIADHFTIEPAVDGRFERHGATQVFVPNGLAESTLYTVTIEAGLAGVASDLAMPDAVTFRFETTGRSAPERSTVIGRETLEFGPDTAPAMVVLQMTNDPAPAPEPVDITVYRLPSLAAAQATLDDWLDQPRWTTYAVPRMETEDLAVATRFSAPLEPVRGESYVVRFPAALSVGWYIVELEAEPVSQAFLQVSPVSVWVSVMTDRTVAWVNDVTTGRPVPGARASVDDGPPFATSDADGIAIGATPEALVPSVARAGGSTTTADDTPIIRVTAPSGAIVLVPFGVGSGDGYRGEWWEKSAPANDRFWSMLVTDRRLYRPDDRVEVWGFLRERDGGTVPALVGIRVVRAGSDRIEGAPAVVAATVSPNATGAFSAELPFMGLPTGSYEVQVVVEDEVIASGWVEIAIIRKPAYQLEVSSDHTAVIVGTPVSWTVEASFFEGTPAPAITLDVSLGNSEATPLTTDESGHATMTGTAPISSYDDWQDADSWGFFAAPSGPEAGAIWGDASVLVFPSAYDLQASGRLVGSSLEVSGTLRTIDLEKVEAALAAGTWSGDAGGAPVGGKAVRIEVTELIPVERIVGTSYDFIEKISRPIIEYEIERRAVGTIRATSAASGAFSASVSIPNAEHQYELRLTAQDPAGRTQLRMAWAGRDVGATWWWDDGPVFQEADGSLAGEATYRIGESIDWRIADRGETVAGGGDDRFLYVTAQRGLRSYDVTADATFRHTFAAADAPGIFVMGVRFTGSTYAPKAATWANYDRDERRIEVAISTDRERYRPGETAEVTVTTRDEAGRPVAADILLQAVDEKLFAIGGASVPTPLDWLFARVDSGIVRLTATHQLPTRGGVEGEGGDTTGGGPRSDFRDTLAFVRLSTDAAGTATTSIRLSDDLTSWHFTAVAATAGLQTGVGEWLMPVGLPFFAEVTTADTYLLADDPSIRLRAFGDALRSGDPVEFTIASEDLGIEPTTLVGTAFEPVTFELPELTLGRLTLDVTARATTRLDATEKPLTDRLLHRFEVIESRLTEPVLVFAVLPQLPDVAGSTVPATYTFSDAGRGRWLTTLELLAEPAGARLDDLVAQLIARGVLIEAFGVEPGRLAPIVRDVTSYPYGSEGGLGATDRSGIALLPYGGLDPWLATRVVILAPDAFPPGAMRDILHQVISAPTTQRDLAIAAVAALAALEEPVLGDLRELATLDDLTVGERIHLALGFAALGDDAAALEIERELLRELGEQQGRWVRLRAGASLDEMANATALLGVVAASLGDPIAADMAAYVGDNASTSTRHRLELAAIAARSVARTPAAQAAFAVTVAGDRQVVRLEPGQSFTLELTGPQRRTLEVERLSGRVGVAVASRVPVDPGGLRNSADVTFERTGPAASVPADGVVLVSFRVTFANVASQSGCYEVVELVPSGLAPLDIGLGWGGTEDRAWWPSSVAGQVVAFCVPNDPQYGRTVQLRYKARIVGEGRYAWEPAILELVGGGDVGAFTPSRVLTIGGAR